MIKLIAIDMDGTLLNNQKQLPQENIEALQKASQAGYDVVLCTGRCQSGVEPYARELGLGQDNEFAILNNGCSTFALKDWSLVDYVTLSDQEVKALLEMVKDYEDIYLTLTEQERFLVFADQVPEIVAYDASLIFTQAQTISWSDFQAGHGRIFQAMIMGDSNALDRFHDENCPYFDQHFSHVRSQHYIVEALPKGTTKASGLKALAQQLGIDRSEIMALGDAANDLEMLKFAGHSVAMGNAAASVKAVCNYQTASNDQAGVAQAIYEYVLK
ncbi:Cof-type HAD-IIB family hydrolase [Streptococcus sobrinus]|uniref:Cof-type HAD-IIB family hydrolase n=1 Tax=Streptococcus sobrinus TaxID=1310 RepID=A0ABM6W5R2_9STRE|nr:Cof-type HAD-IIB family hydrolase [Streptococcus sobrinus]AWN20192.1 Cof-type HAD-IIB family hydrolase [Streptococcus sobrinus]EMP72930.1 hypothetical protein D823_00570 [Streptococcus sobrinus DSM 20742 = ATCC 33478]SQG12912.1 HAD-superfamily hydrolase / phosphatase [Streptococcus sobrinus]